MGTSGACAYAILILDPLEFRRQGLVGTVESWARSVDAELVSLSPCDLSSALEIGEVTLVVLSLGASSVSASDTEAWLGDIRRFAPGAPIAVLSDIETPEEAAAVIRAGLQGLLPTSLRPSIVLHAFDFIRSGGTYFPPSLLLPAFEAAGDPHDGISPAGGHQIEVGEFAGLTHRQSDVLALLRQGRSNKLIARALDMQESTVKVHVRQIMRKMGAANRTQAALMAAGSSVQRPLPGRLAPSPASVPSMAAAAAGSAPGLAATPA